MTASLWEFALEFYGRPGVSAACLTLQDEAGIDVIEMIVAIYADCHGEPLDREGILELRQKMAVWRQSVVVPLRSVRRFLRAPLAEHEGEKEKLRALVKGVELEAEKLQLALAENWLQRREARDGSPLRQVMTDMLNPSSVEGDLPALVEKAIATLLAARASANVTG